MILYRTTQGAMFNHSDGSWWIIPGKAWDQLLVRDDLYTHLTSIANSSDPCTTPVDDNDVPIDVVAPIVSQEVWACGVTYYRSRDARMAESKQAGGGDFYDRVYTAHRPEIFFKATAHRTSGHRQPVRIRSDATWNVPEPELALLVTPNGKITGYTVGNDMSSRDIEGENPLYLPQAKVYDGCCALGPGIIVTESPLPGHTQIQLKIQRGGQTEFSGQIKLSQLKREPPSLVDFLFRDNSFPNGCFLLTGTGIVPPDTFTLQSGDEIHIVIESIGTLINPVA